MFSFAQACTHNHTCIEFDLRGYVVEVDETNVACPYSVHWENGSGSHEPEGDLVLVREFFQEFQEPLEIPAHEGKFLHYPKDGGSARWSCCDQIMFQPCLKSRK